MAQNNKLKSIWLKVGAVLLIVIGLLLIFNKPLGNRMIKHNQYTALATLTPKKIKVNKKKKGMYDFNKVKPMNTQQAAQAQINKTSGAIGAIAIPDVNLHLPIMLGLSNDAMSTGGGTMRKDQVMGKGNYPLAGHYMTANGILFSPLENTKTGELVYLTNLKHVYVYRIYMKKVVKPTAVWLVDNTKQNIVTLITCADGGTNRWAIRGKLIKTEKATKNNLQVFQLNN